MLGRLFSRNKSVPASLVPNNTWINQSTSRTVIIFVHGILSDSDSCWRNREANSYWPQLTVEDPAFEDAAVFVSGYTAGLRAGMYDIPQAAEDVLICLRSLDAGPSPLDKDRLLFVCHSQGGIIVRQMLCSHPEAFYTKRVGVVLCGSPSWGSIYGTILAPIAMLLRSQQGMALKWGGPTLRALDRQFLLLIGRNGIPNLKGECLAETEGRILFLPVPKIVAAASATRYFNSYHHIPNTTHSSLVKPDSRTHLSHVHLRDFALLNGFLTKKALKKNLKILLETMAAVLNAYDLTRPLGIKQKTKTLEKLFKEVADTLDLADTEDRFSGTQLKQLRTATIDGQQAWAFYDFPKADFEQLQRSLADLVKSL